MRQGVEREGAGEKGHRPCAQDCGETLSGPGRGGQDNSTAQGELISGGWWWSSGGRRSRWVIMGSSKSGGVAE